MMGLVEGAVAATLKAVAATVGGAGRTVTGAEGTER